jgi:hypothetical protein
MCPACQAAAAARHDWKPRAGRQPQPDLGDRAAPARHWPVGWPWLGWGAIGQVGGRLRTKLSSSLPVHALRSPPPAVLPLIPAGFQGAVALRQLVR